MDEHKLCFKNHARTHVKLTQCTYEWTITNFLYTVVNCETGHKIKSPTFTAGPKNEFTWYLMLYPSGCNAEYTDYVSIHPVCHNGYNYFDYFIMHVLIIRDDGQGSDIQKTVRVKVPGDALHIYATCMFPNFVKRNDLITDTANNLLCNKKHLKIRCNLTFTNGLVHDPQPTTALLPVEPESPIDFEQFLDSAKFSDVKLVLNGGKEFPVHRIILSARSRVFAAMFEHDMKEQKENRVEITDVDAEVMREVLRFVYTGKVNNDIKAIASDLFAAADKYAIDGLKKICENSLIQGLSLMNVGDVLEIADRHGAEALKKAALDFVAVHVKELADSETFRKSMTSVSHMLGEMLNALTLKYK